MKTLGTDGSKMTALFARSKVKMPKILTRRSSPSSSSSTKPRAVDLDPPPAALTFKENLEQRNLLTACQQLIAQEDHLFNISSSSPAEMEQLQTDHEVLFNQVWLVIEASLSSGEEELETLREAVMTIQLDEEQDKRWQKAKESGTERVPDWRPFNCRSTHDDLLSKMVKKRMGNTENLSGGDNLSSSLKKDVFKMGKCLKEDLKKVVRDLKGRYPEEFDVCNLYARLYHQAFLASLLEITEFTLDLQDLIYILYWVHSLYPNDVLKSTELKEDINCELGCLLPADVLGPLEDQYVSYKMGVLKTWASNALKNEEECCLKGDLPEIFDGCYFTHIAIDVIEIFNEAAKEAKCVLGDLDKVRSITGQLNIFLVSYKSFLEAVLKRKCGNIVPRLKAHLASFEKFKDYIMNNGDLFTDDVRESCLSIIAELKRSCHAHITCNVHKDLKPAYSKLGTATWLTEDPMEILEGLEENIENVKTALNKDCCEELLGQLHKEVVAEYVCRLMKRKVKLADADQQRKAAMLVDKDNERLHAVFMEAGSKEDWLRNVLFKIAEVLRIQDVGILQLEVATLVRDFPDISSLHIKSLLSLKRTLSASDIYKIKHGVKENRTAVDSSSSSRSFFFMVSVK